MRFLMKRWSCSMMLFKLFWCKFGMRPHSGRFLTSIDKNFVYAARAACQTFGIRATPHPAFKFGTDPSSSALPDRCPRWQLLPGGSSSAPAVVSLSVLLLHDVIQVLTAAHFYRSGNSPLCLRSATHGAGRHRHPRVIFAGATASSPCAETFRQHLHHPYDYGRSPRSIEN
jgi:hypothetical protein